jgi:hypothetical protein
MTDIQDAVALARDFELTTAISVTEAELSHVRALQQLRGHKDMRLVDDELQVLARLADLKLQLGAL